MKKKILGAFGVLIFSTCLFQVHADIIFNPTYYDGAQKFDNKVCWQSSGFMTRDGCILEGVDEAECALNDAYEWSDYYAGKPGVGCKIKDIKEYGREEYGMKPGIFYSLQITEFHLIFGVLGLILLAVIFGIYKLVKFILRKVKKKHDAQ